jgi:hypothetical protein
VITGSRSKKGQGRRFARAAITAGAALLGMQGVAAQAQTLLTANARYPRILTLPGGELIASTLTVPNAFNVKIFSSTDNGASFKQIATIDDPEFAPKRTSSPDVFYLPKTGTLIMALDVDTKECETCRSKIKLYKSTDKGRTWSYLSTPVTSSQPKGFWEPDFSIAADGALVMHYADESSDCCSQKLVRIRSYDGGATWKDRTNTVALMRTPKLRPGMSVVSKLANGHWLMTYEVCGQPKEIQCESRYRVSKDGWDYGDTTAIGTKMKDTQGRFFAGTPVNTVLPDGSILWTGKYLRNADGSLSPDLGKVLFKSASGNPDGPWVAIPAPVPRPNPVNLNNCDGYSPGLEPIGNGTKVAMVNARLEGGVCTMYFGTGSTK